MPAPREPVRRVRSRTGHELDVVDISACGVLVESRSRLLPNTHMDIHLIIRSGRVLVRCRVVRAYVCHVEADLVRYRVGLTFDQTVDTTPGYLVPGDLRNGFREVGSTYPGSPLDAAPSGQDDASG